METRDVKTISTIQYIAGGVITFFIGLGVGYAIQKRYKERGCIFTVLESAGFVFIITGFMSTAFCKMNYQATCKGILLLTTILLIIASVVIRIWEIVDIWILPSHFKLKSSLTI